MDPETPQNQSFVPEQTGGTGEGDQTKEAPQTSIPPQPIQEPAASPPPEPQRSTALGDQGGPKGPKMTTIAVIFLVLSLVGLGAYFLSTRSSKQKACTQEAKICPDGTGVGRVGPNCEFAPCPTLTATPDPTVNWETYEDEKLGISFKIPNKEDLVSDYATFNGRAKNAQPATLLIAKPYYNTKMEDCGSLPLTKNCFADPSGWGQTEKVKVTALGGITAISYFVNDVGIGGPVHVVETVSSPIFQMAQAVGGVGLEEMFVQILSTLKLLEPTASASPTTSPSASPQGLTP